MASMPGSPNIPFLPPEIYLALARHVYRDDLPNYRLANKLLAEAGKPELFNIITLRSTLASISALNCIVQNEQLSRLVRALIWDVNYWRVGTDVRDWHEWTRHCESRANDVGPDQAALYKELAASRRHWEAYLSRREEEKVAIDEICHMVGERPFCGFELPNMRKLHVVKGAYQLHNWQVYRQQEHAKLPVTVPLSEWRGDSLPRLSSKLLLSVIPAIASRGTKWRIDGLTAQDQEMLNNGSVLYDADFASVKIRLGTSLSSRFTFVLLINQWPNLESFTLDLHNRVRRRVHERRTTRAIRTIGDVFEVSGQFDTREGLVTWPKLRKLSLGHFDSTVNSLLSLVIRHSSTLRDLRLHAIWLLQKSNGPSEPNSWREVFRSIEATTNLEKMTLSGTFRNKSHEGDVWDFDDKELAGVVADWIISGGECPLADGYNSILESLSS